MATSLLSANSRSSGGSGLSIIQSIDEPLTARSVYGNSSYPDYTIGQSAVLYSDEKFAIFRIKTGTSANMTLSDKNNTYCTIINFTIPQQYAPPVPVYQYFYGGRSAYLLIRIDPYGVIHTSMLSGSSYGYVADIVNPCFMWEIV